MWDVAWQNYRMIAIIGFSFTLGFSVASGPQSIAANTRLRERVREMHEALSARDGELELARDELKRVNSVMENSRRYRIPADLATKIYDIARAEGIDPRVAFSLVEIESDFAHRAISPVGALGLTQLMPNTARFFDPSISRTDLFDPDTNLRIGFRFLRELIAKYDGNVDKALTAYNRGPSVVDRHIEQQRDPANGYSSAVLSGAARTRGTKD
jgi:soluble lytic murein transglycosylase-like protein